MIVDLFRALDVIVMPHDVVDGQSISEQNYTEIILYSVILVVIIFLIGYAIFKTREVKRKES